MFGAITYSSKNAVFGKLTCKSLWLLWQSFDENPTIATMLFWKNWGLFKAKNFKMQTVNFMNDMIKH